MGNVLGKLLQHPELGVYKNSATFIVNAVRLKGCGGDSTRPVSSDHRPRSSCTTECRILCLELAKVQWFFRWSQYLLNSRRTSNSVSGAASKSIDGGLAFGSCIVNVS